MGPVASRRPALSRKRSMDLFTLSEHGIIRGRDEPGEPYRKNGYPPELSRLPDQKMERRLMQCTVTATHPSCSLDNSATFCFYTNMLCDGGWRHCPLCVNSPDSHSVNTRLCYQDCLITVKECRQIKEKTRRKKKQIINKPPSSLKPPIHGNLHLAPPPLISARQIHTEVQQSRLPLAGRSLT